MNVFHSDIRRKVGWIPLVRTLSKPHRAGDLHIHPKPRNAHVPQGFPRSGNVAGQFSWRNATRPAERFRRGDRRGGAVADTGETCRALRRMPSGETLRCCGKNRGPASASAGLAPRCPTNPFGMTAYRNLELVLPARSSRSGLLSSFNGSGAVRVWRTAAIRRAN